MKDERIRAGKYKAKRFKIYVWSAGSGWYAAVREPNGARRIQYGATANAAIKNLMELSRKRRYQRRHGGPADL